MTAIAAQRQPASPYARRLARERGITLELITGTGPGGRIVAADVEAFVGRPAAPPQGLAAPASTVSAYGTSIDLGALQALLASLSQSQSAVALDDMLVRAGALALEALALPGMNAAIGLESGGGASAKLAVVTDAHLGLVSRLHTQLAEAITTAAATTAQLTLRRLAQRGIRPLAMPLLPGASLRLIISAGDTDAAAEVLLVFDAARVGEDDAAAFLAHFRDGLETPLRLLA
jgi:pyruvate/2-oxoglutarate dehydrogenase complex dihydrolipoamide acyltransferase (E2) component